MLIDSVAPGTFIPGERLIYAVGRGLEYYDKRPVKEVVSTLGRDNYKFSTLVVGVVKSDPFRLRRGKNQVAVTK